MSNNMQVYEQVRKVPAEALKPILGGRLKGMSDINPMWRIKMLTEVFGLGGIGWKTEITDKRLERGHGDEVMCFVDINLYVKVDGEWSSAIPGMGGSSYITQERNGLHTNDECYKMAYTDAIGVACKSLGFAADVYFEKDRTKYTNEGDHGAQNVAQSTQQQHTNNPPDKQQTPPTGQHHRPSPKYPASTPAPSTTNTGAVLISAAQKGMVRALIKENSIPDDVFKGWVADCGVASSNDLSKQQASAIIKKCQEYKLEDIADDDLPF